MQTTKSSGYRQKKLNQETNNNGKNICNIDNFQDQNKPNNKQVKNGINEFTEITPEQMKTHSYLKINHKLKLFMDKIKRF